MDFNIAGPLVNIGLEARLKYTTLRFGVDRQLKTLGFTSSTQKYAAGSVDNEDTYSTFTLGGDGTYNYMAGMGFHYGNLKVDILINNNFWITGPQMIFNNIYGTLGLCADLIYTF